VTLVDGGTWGLSLLPAVEDAKQLLILDAVRGGAAPGTLHRLGREQLPRLFAHKLSPHQIDLQETLALAELRGTLPELVAAIGIEPEIVELGIGLSASATAALDAMVLAAIEQLEGWGHRCQSGAAVDA
jgi:hydrogenase maturation protease